MIRRHASAAFICVLLIPLTAGRSAARPDESSMDTPFQGDSRLEVTVGMAGFLKQVVLPGPELTVKEVDPRRTAVAVRIDAVYPHGEDFRYDLTWFGLEPGTYNLSDYLARKNGTLTDDLPQILLTVNSILPEQQLMPHESALGDKLQIGGYRTKLWLALVIWFAGLMAIIFLGRAGKQKSAASAAAEVLSPLDEIRILIDRAQLAGELCAADKADLDVRILNFWRERRALADIPVAEALVQLKQDQQAGPLLVGLERWLYGRHTPDRDEVAALLEPLARLADTTTAEPSVAAGGVG